MPHSLFSRPRRRICFAIDLSCIRLRGNGKSSRNPIRHCDRAWGIVNLWIVDVWRVVLWVVLVDSHEITGASNRCFVALPVASMLSTIYALFLQRNKVDLLLTGVWTSRGRIFSHLGHVHSCCVCGYTVTIGVDTNTIISMCRHHWDLDSTLFTSREESLWFCILTCWVFLPLVLAWGGGALCPLILALKLGSIEGWEKVSADRSHLLHLCAVWATQV